MVVGLKLYCHARDCFELVKQRDFCTSNREIIRGQDRAFLTRARQSWSISIAAC